MKEDVLEQIVDDYLQHLGYFTQPNIRFRPRKDHPDFQSRPDSVFSDIDVVAARRWPPPWHATCTSGPSLTRTPTPACTGRESSVPSRRLIDIGLARRINSLSSRQVNL